MILSKTVSIDLDMRARLSRAFSDYLDTGRAGGLFLRWAGWRKGLK